MDSQPKAVKWFWRNLRRWLGHSRYIIMCKIVPGVGKITVGSLAPMTREYSNEVIKTAVAPLFLAENAEKVGVFHFMINCFYRENVKRRVSQ